VTSSPSSAFQYQNLAYGGTVGQRNADAFEPHPMSLSAHYNCIGYYHFGSFMTYTVQWDGVLQCQT
jgi:hypothetical protein